jgi:hypothetical protein
VVKEVKRKMNRLYVLLVTLLVLCSCVTVAGDPPASTAMAKPRYTFSWPLNDSKALKPRGGTMRGAEVTLDLAESADWRALQSSNLSAFERDRRAILAMAGTYRVSFDFLEVVPFDANAQPKAPYQSWGTEKIYVDRNEGGFISLVHILEMRIKQDDSSVSEPMVTKHWRQDWRYEPEYIVEFKGRDRWQRRKLAPAQAKGQWLQTVYQVDESPRYASVGRWQHTPSFSTWLSGETWRPLPRREWSVRNDYQVLIGTNRHTITRHGWIQEENNLKGVLATDRQLEDEQPFLAREYGVARYERIRDMDFAAADRYYERTRQFWNEVRARWNDAFASQEHITLRGPVDQFGLFVPLFEHAEAIAQGEQIANSSSRQVIGDALKDMGAVR